MIALNLRASGFFLLPNFRQEREKFFFKKEGSGCTPVKTQNTFDLKTPTKTPGRPELERVRSIEAIKADPELMTYGDELQLIADLYSECLKSKCKTLKL